MGPLVLRRKLQKKKKRKTYRKCPQCGRRSECFLYTGKINPNNEEMCEFQVELWQECRVRYDLGGCGFKQRLFWSGGESGRRIPQE